MLESFVRPEERSVFIIGRVPVASDPRPILPESGICLLISKQIVVIRVRIRAVDREVIRRLESQMRPTKAGAW